MTEETFNQTLNTLRQRQPWRPFTVALHGGRRWEVDSPQALSTREGVSLALFLTPGGAPVIFDHEAVIEIYGVPLAEVPPLNEHVDPEEGS